MAPVIVTAPVGIFIERPCDEGGALGLWSGAYPPVVGEVHESDHQEQRDTVPDMGACGRVKGYTYPARYGKTDKLALR